MILKLSKASSLTPCDTATITRWQHIFQIREGWRDSASPPVFRKSWKDQKHRVKLPADNPSESAQQHCVSGNISERTFNFRTAYFCLGSQKWCQGRRMASSTIEVEVWQRKKINFMPDCFWILPLCSHNFPTMLNMEQCSLSGTALDVHSNWDLKVVSANFEKKICFLQQRYLKKRHHLALSCHPSPHVSENQNLAHRVLLEKPQGEKWFASSSLPETTV